MQPRDDFENTAPSKEVAVEDEDEGQYPTGVALWSVLVPVTIGYFLYFLDTCIVATASPAITVSFNSLIDIGWYGGAYQLGNAAIRPLTGKIYSHFNIKAGYSNPYPVLPLWKEREIILILRYSGLSSSFFSSSKLGLPLQEQLCHRPCLSSAEPSQVLEPQVSQLALSLSFHVFCRSGSRLRLWGSIWVSAKWVSPWDPSLEVYLPNMFRGAGVSRFNLVFLLTHISIAPKILDLLLTRRLSKAFTSICPSAASSLHFSYSPVFPRRPLSYLHYRSSAQQLSL